MNLNLNIRSVEVLKTIGADIVNIHLNDVPTPFPKLGFPAILKIETAQGHGLSWCQEALGIAPEYVKIIENTVIPV